MAMGLKEGLHGRNKHEARKAEEYSDGENPIASKGLGELGACVFEVIETIIQMWTNETEISTPPAMALQNCMSVGEMLAIRFARSPPTSAMTNSSSAATSLKAPNIGSSSFGWANARHRGLAV
eukprot:CAMPEP_0179322822 /NCGR_PEP_ID=MMETSP0797-20121207/59383_1 /TAXON_ID=47934 /ORGANISM="Dinophysis acuminata, Strain DAEP01" /LENGTH=122 /DNA_ID=CAMNT_0021034605 /DNA_START=108 /DNA_END=477 /DNA_ORIENTATION=+